MSSSNSSTDKVEASTKSYKYECLDCENYKRKVKEAEHTVSGRDVLIEMLQEEIKKMEGRYKTSIDDYELLRFKYCTVVQELSNLKEINKKLEKSNAKLIKERDISKDQLERLLCDVERCKELQIQVIPNESGVEIKPNNTENNALHENILKEVMNIEALMQNQNEAVRGALLTVLNEMKNTKSCRQIEEVVQNKSTYNTYSAKDQGKNELLGNIEDLSNQIEELNTIIEKLKEENETIKNQLEEKKSNLAQCLNVLEDNHSNLNSLSGNIEMIINEKETYLKEIGHLKDVIEESNAVLKQKDKDINELKRKLDDMSEQTDVDDLRKENEALQSTLSQCQGDLKKLQDSYFEKSEKCNIETCKQLALAMLQANSIEGAVNNVNINKAVDPRLEPDETENEFVELKKKISELEYEIDSYKIKVLQLEDASENIDTYETQIASLKEKIKSLEHDVEQAKLENNEYEEENKYYCQKVESLVVKMHMLEKEKSELQSNMEDPKIAKLQELQEDYESFTIQKEKEIKDLKDEINYLQQNNQETAKVMVEKERLKTQLENLQNEITRIQEEDEKQILQLQEQINRLENSQNENLKQIDKCCCVVRNMKATIADKNIMEENNLVQMKTLEEQRQKLEKENQQLQQQICFLKSEMASLQEKFKDCDCKSGKVEAEMINLESMNTKLQNNIKEMEVEICQRECLNEKLQKDIKEMEIEICRRQCTINHLEQCLDKSNKILGECEKEMKEMHSENENLKKENEIFSNNLKSYVTEVERNSAEKKDLQEQMVKATRQSQVLESDKRRLMKSLEDKSNIEDELNLLDQKYNSLVETTREKDEAVRTARVEIQNLQQVLESSKKEYDKIMKAYKEMKQTLTEEIKKYKQQVESMSKENVKVDIKPESKCTACSDVQELNCKLIEKERKIKTLERQNRDLAGEVADLKSYVNKIISDNKNLRTAIDRLLANLVEKLKNFTDSAEQISLKSNELIVKDILNSLIDLEKNVNLANNSTSMEKCNCMSVIMSTYKLNRKDSKSGNMPSCKMKCGKRIKDPSKYDNTSMSSSRGIISICADCCGGEKGQEDPPESRTSSAVNNTLQSVSNSFTIEPDFR